VPLVAQEFRPTLREELAHRRPATRWAISGVLALIALAWLVWVLVPRSNGTHFVHRSAPVFNLRYAPSFERLAPQRGEFLHLRRRRHGRDTDSFSVSRLTLPPYRGDVAGLLPVYAEQVLGELRAAYPGLKLLEEGRARVNLVPGYYLLFRVGSGPSRMFGREVLLPEPVAGGVAGSRTGVRMALRTWRGSGVTQARDLGAVGWLRTPYRSFRYGTEAP
jgi:hypothetical protein